eukprot:g29469.t1
MRPSDPIAQAWDWPLTRVQQMSRLQDPSSQANDVKSRGVFIEDKQKVWTCTDGRRGAVPTWAQITGEAPAHAMRPAAAVPVQAVQMHQPQRPSIEDELVSLAVAAARHPDTATRALQALRQAGAQRGSRRERRAGRDRIRQLLHTYTGHTYVPGLLGLKTEFFGGKG